MSPTSRLHLPGCAVLSVLFSAGVASADVLGTYTFDGADPAGDNQTPNDNGTAVANVTFGSFSRVNIVSRASNAIFRSTGYSTASSINLSQYAQFTVTADAGYALELTSLEFRSVRVDDGTNRGPFNGAARSSFESYQAGSGTGSTYSTTTGSTVADPVWDFTDYTSGSAGSVAFRFYGWGATGSQANAGLAIDNVTLNGHIVALAQMQASAAADPAGPVIVGATADVDVSIQNTAAGGTRQQDLSYSVSGDGNLTGGGSGSIQPGAPDVIVLSVDTSAAGARGGNVSVTSNAYATNGQVGTSSFDQLVTVNVLDHSNASFADDGDLDEITVDFGTVEQGSTQSIGRSIFNLIQTTGFTAALDLDVIDETDPDGVFSTDLASFADLAAGASADFLISLDTAQTGAFSGSYLLTLSDQDLPGATGGQTLTINLSGTVAAVPEPAAPALLLLAGASLLRRRLAGGGEPPTRPSAFQAARRAIR